MVIINRIRKAVAIITTVALTSTLILVIFAVFFRYALNNPIPWAETVSRLLFVWTIFLGSSLCYYRGSMFKVELVKNPPRLLILLRKGIEIFVIIVMLYGALLLLPTIAKQYMSVFPNFFPIVNMSWPFVAIPIGLLLLLGEVVISLYEGFFQIGKEN